jgi:hypothetical protein
MVAMSLSLWTNAHLTNLSDNGDLIRPLLIRSFGLGAVFVPLNLLAVGDIPARSRDNAALTLLAERMNLFALVRSFEREFTMLALIFSASISLVVLLLRKPREGTGATLAAH